MIRKARVWEKEYYSAFERVQLYPIVLNGDIWMKNKESAYRMDRSVLLVRDCSDDRCLTLLFAK